jgi:hypothetical protein
MSFTPKPPHPRYSTRAHRAARAKLLAAYQPGDPCCICGHPMYPLPDGRTSNLHADHHPDDETGQTYRGLAHGEPCQDCGARCNQSDGAQRGRARQDETTEQDARWIL